MDPIELGNERLRLSRPTVRDVDAITRACQDPQVAAWVTVPSPYDRSDAESFLRHVVGPGWDNGTELVWAMREPLGAPEPGGDGDLLGMIGLHGVGDGTAEIGYWVAPWARGRGTAQQAVELVLDHAFDGLDLLRVTWQAFVGNWPSRRVAWRAGFRVEGTVRLHGLQRGVRRDSWVGTLLREDPRVPAQPWPQERMHP